MKLIILSSLFIFSSISLAVSPNDKYPMTYLDMLVSRAVSFSHQISKPAKVTNAYFGPQKPMTVKVEVQIEGAITAEERAEIEKFYTDLVNEEASDLKITGTKVFIDFQDTSDATRIIK